MKYILDTNICIYWLKGHIKIEQKILDVGFENIGTTIITIAELYYGAYKSKKVETNLENLRKLEDKIHILQTSKRAGEHFGKTKAILEEKGKIIEDADILIASIVFTNNSILFTNNPSHFERIEGLQVENWMKDDVSKRNKNN